MCHLSLFSACTLPIMMHNPFVAKHQFGSSELQVKDYMCLVVVSLHFLDAGLSYLSPHLLMANYHFRSGVFIVI